MSVKIDLNGTFGYGPPRKKVYYGPGKGVSVPRDLARALGKLPPSEAKAATPGVDSRATQAKGAAPAASAASEPLSGRVRVESVGLSEGAAQALRDAGFASVASLRKAPDEELLAVPGIGAATLQQIRALVGE